MKRFSIEKLGNVRERLGNWDLANNVPPIQSPGLWLTTSTCGVPHLTPETFEMTGLQEHFAGQDVFTYLKNSYILLRMLLFKT